MNAERGEIWDERTTFADIEEKKGGVAGAVREAARRTKGNETSGTREGMVASAR